MPLAVVGCQSHCSMQTPRGSVCFCSTALSRPILCPYPARQALHKGQFMWVVGGYLELIDFITPATQFSLTLPILPSYNEPLNIENSGIRNHPCQFWGWLEGGGFSLKLGAAARSAHQRLLVVLVFMQVLLPRCVCKVVVSRMNYI